MPPLWLAALLVLPFSVSTATIAPASAEEPVAIGRILAEPDLFHLKTVAVRGTVLDLRMIEPYQQPTGATCYGAYQFTVGDETGSMDVTVLGVCGVPLFRPPAIMAGDRVTVLLQIQDAAHLGAFFGLDGRPVPHLSQQTPLALAREIFRIELKPSAPAP
ncbi:MAG: hypothetical protein AB1411_13830 [Nitrospirota bacterium]